MQEILLGLILAAILVLIYHVHQIHLAASLYVQTVTLPEKESFNAHHLVVASHNGVDSRSLYSKQNKLEGFLGDVTSSASWPSTDENKNYEVKLAKELVGELAG